MKSNKIEMTGMRFGILTVLEETPERQRGNVVWKCQCDCGVIKNINGYNLRNGTSTSCGCKSNKSNRNKFRKHNKFGGHNKLELKGQRFGHLTVIKELPERRFGHVQWECLCDCGKTINARSVQLTGGTTKSCGHLNRSTLAGQQFGQLYVISELPHRHNGNIMWLCECDCGISREVSSADLNAGRVTRCQVC